jgi:hypothetical protein
VTDGQFPAECVVFPLKKQRYKSHQSHLDTGINLNDNRKKVSKNIFSCVAYGIHENLVRIRIRGSIALFA